MGANRVLGGTFSPVFVPPDELFFETNHQSDAFLVGTLVSGGQPVTATLDPNAVNGDRVIIKDFTGNAATNNITVQAVGSQAIEGHPSGIVLNQAYASVTLYFVHGAASANIHAGVWVVDTLLNSASVPQ